MKKGQREILYSSGTEVHLGDKVLKKGFFRKKPGIIAYLPGVSEKRDYMEFNELRWVGIKFEDGTMTGTIVLPGTNQLKKSIVFLTRGPTPAYEFPRKEPD